MSEKLCPSMAPLPLGPELPPQPDEGTWRNAIKATSLALQAPDLDPALPPSVTQLLQNQGYDEFLHPKSQDKAERHAVEGAIIEQITDELVEGYGPQTRFKALPEGNLENLLWDVEQAYGDAFEAAVSRQLFDLLTYLLRRYCSPGQATDTLAAIAIGTATPGEIQNFNLHIPRLLKEHPLTQHLPEAQRIERAHRLLSLSLGKAAINMPAFEKTPLWHTEIRNAEIHTRKGVGNDSIYNVVHKDGGPLFSIPTEKLVELLNKEPVFFCPAVQRDALKRTLHAGVNAAAERGAYR